MTYMGSGRCFCAKNRGSRLSRLAMEISHENIPKIIINSSRLQTRRSIYVFLSARQGVRNGGVHFGIWWSWGSRLSQLDQARTAPLSFWLAVFFLGLCCIYLTSTIPLAPFKHLGHFLVSTPTNTWFFLSLRSDANMPLRSTARVLHAT
jgi:hypothetical protein